MDAAFIGTPLRRNGLPVASLSGRRPTHKIWRRQAKKESALAVLAACRGGSVLAFRGLPIGSIAAINLRRRGRGEVGSGLAPTQTHIQMRIVVRGVVRREAWQILELRHLVTLHDSLAGHGITAKLPVVLDQGLENPAARTVFRPIARI